MEIGNIGEFKVQAEGRIGRLAAELALLPQYEPETRHYFADGMYCREVFRRAGVLVVGKVHKREHFYYVSCGTVLVASDTETKEVIGPMMIVSQPGTKRAVFAITDAMCLTVHRTDKTDLAEIEKELIEDDPDAMYGPDNKLKQGVLQ